MRIADEKSINIVRVSDYPLHHPFYLHMSAKDIISRSHERRRGILGIFASVVYRCHTIGSTRSAHAGHGFRISYVGVFDLYNLQDGVLVARTYHFL